MPQLRIHAELRKSCQRLLEAFPLSLEQRMLRIVRGCEVRVDGIDLEVAAGDDLRHRAIEIVEAEAEPVHAGVNLQMTAQFEAARGGRRLQRSAGAGRRDGGSEVVVEH